MEKITAKFNKVVYQNGDFCIASFRPVGDSIGSIPVHPIFGTFSVKGTFPSLNKDEEYEINAIREEHPKYGVSFNLQFIKTGKSVNFNSKEEVFEFLKNITSVARAKDIIDTVGDSIQVVLENGDVKALCEVKGIGERTAEKILEQYDMHKDYSQAYIELGKFDISPNTIRKIVKHYKSVEKAIEMIRENPYALVAIDGYGFKRCDEIYLSVHPNGYSNDVRIRAYVLHLVDTDAYTNGNTWIKLQTLIDKVSNDLGASSKDVSIEIGKLIKSDAILLSDIDSTPKISHAKFKEIEAKVASKLVELSKDGFVYKKEGLDDMIGATEEKQGWEFTGQQKNAINIIADNKVVLLEGLAGSGKSTSLKVILDFYEKNNYSYAQTALSGKASSNLALITGREGSTIHRLLGVAFDGDSPFFYNEKNKLPYDIIIIDEISMVDISIFYHLISAMRSSAKLIMVGDSEQLEAIGVPVMKPLIESGVIARIMLTEIHRQAKKSAVVTHSIAYRKGFFPPIAEGMSTHGELQDLTYNLVNDDDDIKGEVARTFLEKIRSGVSIMDIQILSPKRSNGDSSCFSINSICQKIYNGDETKPSHTITKNNDTYTLRQGDKVINVKNNYSSKDILGEASPVYNGNIGILQDFTTMYDDELDKDVEVAIISFEGIGDIVYNLNDLDMIELAYCITIHKSQGMGVSHVIVAYSFAYTLVSRQSLYTAITRTKVDCTVIAMRKTLKYAISKDATSKKRTHLSEMLNNLLKSA